MIAILAVAFSKREQQKHGIEVQRCDTEGALVSQGFAGASLTRPRKVKTGFGAGAPSPEQLQPRLTSLPCTAVSPT